MATALARQLQAIRSETTATLDKRKHEKVASLLFDPKEAAERDYDTILALGVNGLQGLVQIDSRFKPFAKTLFSETSRDIDRAIQTKSENDDLDRTVNEFLDLLGPHALTRPASKALEWLIKRFRIHVFPVTAESLLFTFLPYHKEPLYARLLQIVSLLPKFAFLGQYADIKAASNLPPVPRQLFVRAMSRDSVFLESYSEFVVSRVKNGFGYSIMITTWVGLLVETISQMRQSRVGEEVIVSRIMPFIAQGLQMKQSSDFQIACYMVLTVLASKGTLTDTVMNAAMDAIVQGWTDESRQMAIMCLVTLAQQREGDSVLTPTVIKTLLSVKDLKSQVDALSPKLKCDKLLMALAKSLISTSNKSDSNIHTLENVMRSSKLTSEGRARIMQMAVQEMTKAQGRHKDAITSWLKSWVQAHSDEFKGFVAPILSLLETEQVKQLEQLTQMKLKTHDPEEMAEIEYTSGASGTESPGKTIPVLPETFTRPSFLLFSSADHNAVIDYFVQMEKAGDKDGVRDLITSPLLSTSPVSLPSLLARIWISPAHPVSARVTALQLFANHFTKPESSSFDLQGFIPHLVVGLSDSNKEVRATAANSIVAYNKTLSHLSSKATVVGLDDLYVEDEKLGGLKWLALPERKWLIESIIIPKLEECRLDPNYVARLVGEAINAAGKKGKKEQYLHLINLSDHSIPTAVLVFLASHVVCSGLSAIQFPLLEILNGFIETPSAVKLKAQSLAPLLEHCKNAKFIKALSEQEPKIDVEEFKRRLVEIVGSGCNSSQIQILIDLANQNGALSLAACRQLAIVFQAAGQNIQLQIVQSFISQLESGSKDVVKMASEVLSAIPIPSSILQSLLEDVKIKVDSRDSSPARKRPRTDSARSSPGVLSEGLSQSMRHLTLILEVLEQQHPEEHAELIPSLINLLDRLVTVESDTRTTLSYPKQMVLSCLISMVGGLKQTPIEGNEFRIDTLIACIRTSTNPQVHNRTLLLLSSLAHIVPELILNHVMPIFTFMGASVLRQDDEYSAHVIEQTIKSIIPILASVAVRGTHFDTSPIISAFVVNFDFIPRHRRLSLFKALLEALGLDQHIHVVLLLLAEKSAQSNEKAKSNVVEFAVDLANSFVIEHRIIAIDRTLDLVRKISQTSMENVDGLPIDVATLSAYALASLTTECLKVVSTILSSRSFQMGMTRYFETAIRTDDFSSPVIEKLLLLRPRLTERNGDYLRTSLDAFLSVLPLPLVSETLNQFLRREKDEAIIRDIITIAARRISSSRTSDIAVKQALTTFLSALNDILKQQKTELSRVALRAAQQLSRAHGKNELSSFEGLLPTIVEYGVRNEDNIIKSTAFECLLAMLPTIGPRILPFLPETVPEILKEFQTTEDGQSTRQLRMASLNFLTGLYERVSTFMSSYLSSVISVIVKLVDDESSIAEARDSAMEAAIQTQNVDVCVEALIECWSSLPRRRKPLDLFVKALEQVIESGSREDLTAMSKSLFDLFLGLFNIRSENVLKQKTLKKIEANVNDVFLKLVMKLNDTTFRPFFITLRDWAFRNATGETKLARQIFFYNFMNKFIDVLQTVVTAYYGIILDDTVQLLKEFVDKSVRDKDLWTSAIRSLHKSFEHDLDQDAYWSSPSRFDKIIQPLLAQLTLSIKPHVVVPAIVALASKTRSEDNFKVINGALMEYMKSDVASVRLAAVDAERELYEELTTEWSKMLPPTVPIISEVMEDEDDNVIEAAHLLIATIEKVTGISMQKLLT